MAFELRDMQGTLFREKEKKSENTPDYHGEIRVGGTTYRLSAWIKTSQKTGDKWMSLSAQPKDGTRPVRTGGKPVEPNEDVPF